MPQLWGTILPRQRKERRVTMIKTVSLWESLHVRNDKNIRKTRDAQEMPQLRGTILPRHQRKERRVTMIKNKRHIWNSRPQKKRTYFLEELRKWTIYRLLKLSRGWSRNESHYLYSLPTVTLVGQMATFNWSTILRNDIVCKAMKFHTNLMLIWVLTGTR